MCQWSELVPAALLNASLWPRAAAVAERLWSPAHVDDEASLYARLEVQQARLLAVGIDSAAPQRALLDQLVPKGKQAPFVELARWLEVRRENWWVGFTQRRPVARFADVLYPESDAGRQLRDLTRRYLETPAASAERRRLDRRLAQALTGIADAGRQVAAEGRDDPALSDAAALGALAAQTSEVGLAALEARRDGRAASASLLAEASATVARQEDRIHGAWVAFAPAVAALVQPAGG